MAVGKSSIIRAANAGTKVKQTVLMPSQEVMKKVQFMANQEEFKKENLKKNNISLNDDMPDYLL